jgi:hypothetical protein
MLTRRELADLNRSFEKVVEQEEGARNRAEDGCRASVEPAWYIECAAPGCRKEEGGGRAEARGLVCVAEGRRRKGEGL